MITFKKLQLVKAMIIQQAAYWTLRISKNIITNNREILSGFKGTKGTRC